MEKVYAEKQNINYCEWSRPRDLHPSRMDLQSIASLLRQTGLIVKMFPSPDLRMSAKMARI